MIEYFHLTHEWHPNRPTQSGSVSNGKEGLIYIPQSSRTGALPSDGLMSYPGLTCLQRCSWYILQPQLNELTKRLISDMSYKQEQMKTGIFGTKSSF